MIEASQDREDVSDPTTTGDGPALDSLNCSGEQIPSPDWHQDVLADRKAPAQRGEAKFLTLDQLRSRLR